ncbi:hypothetical protein VTL71DRAFT_2605 [Oculimacula yallundae]|uniref:Phosphatidylethanolamine-binding protein n=1 Tax=Oculimacula yallundae TaxID=86028 RepID=A0ABR4C9C6_9HELO
MRLITSLLFATAAKTALASLRPQDQLPLSPTSTPSKAEAVQKALSKSSIIPEVLSDFMPKCFITAYYSKDSGKTHQGTVDLGNEFKPKETKQKPGLSITCPDSKGTPGLVVALTDPDAKSRDDPKWSEMCHWIYIVPINFQTTFEAELGAQAKNSLPELVIPASVWQESDFVDYKPPGPPPKTGFHRYVFVVLEGDTTNLTAPSERQHWGTGKVRHGVRDWAEQEDLKVVGANWFVEEDEEQ